MTNTHKRAKRDVVTGWSAGATRRNLQFLYSIDERDLDGEGFAVTLTLRDCPPTAEDWQYLVKQFFMYLKRILSYASAALGGDFTLLRYHYVTEWQRRGVPHLHATIYFSPGCTARNNVRSYLLCCWAAFGIAGNVTVKPWSHLPSSPQPLCRSCVGCMTDSL